MKELKDNTIAEDVASILSDKNMLEKIKQEGLTEEDRIFFAKALSVLKRIKNDKERNSII